MWVLLKDDKVVDVAAQPFEVHKDLKWRQVGDNIEVGIDYVVTADGSFEPPQRQRKLCIYDLVRALAEYCLDKISKSELETIYNEVVRTGETIPVYYRRRPW